VWQPNLWGRHSPCQVLDTAVFGMPVWIKRDDLLHPTVSGNKFRKLKYPLRAVAEQVVAQQTAESGAVTVPQLITMGGLWSNHVHATAHAAALCGYASVGLVRGHVGMSSAMLDDCRVQGMQIQFVDRATYRTLRDDPDRWRDLVLDSEGNQAAVWLPEGGSVPAALHGVAELIGELPFVPDVMVVACGTAATLAGLLAGLQGRGRVIGIAVLRHADYLRDEVTRLLLQAGYPNYDNYQLLTDFHHGGYAKTTPQLLQFCREFSAQCGVPVEPVYTGKVAYALRELVRSGFILESERVIMLHTGGLQGARGQSVDELFCAGV